MEAIVDAIGKATYFIEGVIDLPACSNKVFFQRGPTFGSVDLLNPTDEKLELLTDACEPASFGRNHEDILDETYRKAGKLDVSDFAINLDLCGAGLISKICSSLLTEDRNIRADLYKLNLYGEYRGPYLVYKLTGTTQGLGLSSSFKAHKDTPRGLSMFGSLVLALPIPHEGGELVLRFPNEGSEDYTLSDDEDVTEVKIDSAAYLMTHDKPVITYAAFYGDIEHEVLPLKSGNRITLTYNLYYEGIPGEDTAGSEGQNIFQQLLSEKMRPGPPSLLPEGGWMGYPLKHAYPYGRRGDLGHVADNLKAAGVAFLRACNCLNINASIKVVYKVTDSERGNRYISFSHVPTETVDDGEHEEGRFSILMELEDAVEVTWDGLSEREYVGDDDDDDSDGDVRVERHIHWLKKPQFSDYFHKFRGPDLPWVHYGNQATLDFDYGSFYFLLEVEPYVEREELAAVLQ
ncbi:hypothetical protein ONZ45_g1261 [Pleurotus djamor]|nr:hypothetical protein ONZ45_g1261 [Pleurotus djamor]